MSGIWATVAGQWLLLPYMELTTARAAGPRPLPVYTSALHPPHRSHRDSYKMTKMTRGTVPVTLSAKTLTEGSLALYKLHANKHLEWKSKICRDRLNSECIKREVTNAVWEATAVTPNWGKRDSDYYHWYSHITTYTSPYHKQSWQTLISFQKVSNPAESVGEKFGTWTNTFANKPIKSMHLCGMINYQVCGDGKTNLD